MSGKRVLVVDDEAIIALYTAEVLQEAGYEIVGPASHLNSALALARQEELYAAVLDVNLAGVPVWPLVNLLQDRGVPFVLLTGFGKGVKTPESCKNALRIGKPFRPAELLEALSKAGEGMPG